MVGITRSKVIYGICKSSESRSLLVKSVLASSCENSMDCVKLKRLVAILDHLGRPDQSTYISVMTGVDSLIISESVNPLIYGRCLEHRETFREHNPSILQGTPRRHITRFFDAFRMFPRPEGPPRHQRQCEHRTRWCPLLLEFLYPSFSHKDRRRHRPSLVFGARTCGVRLGGLSDGEPRGEGGDFGDHLLNALGHRRATDLRGSSAPGLWDPWQHHVGKMDCERDAPSPWMVLLEQKEERSQFEFQGP